MLLINDLDGHLRNINLEGIYKAWCGFCQKLKVDHSHCFYDFETFMKFFDHDLVKMLKTLKNFSDEELKIVSDTFHEIYDPSIKKFKWVDKIIPRLAKKHTLSILTSSSATSARRTLGKTIHYFTLILGSEIVKKKKPKPDGILLVMEKLSFRPQETVMIGDSTADIMAAKNAGVKVALVGWSLFIEKENLLSYNPDYLIRKPEDLLKI